MNTRELVKKRLQEAYDDWYANQDKGWKLLKKREELKRQKCKNKDEEYAKKCKLAGLEDDIKYHYEERIKTKTQIDCYEEILESLCKEEQDV